MKRAIRSVIDTYPVFYTRVIMHDGELRQYPDYGLQIDIPVERISEEEVEQRIAQFIWPFDLNKDPLSRFLLIETPESLYFVYDIFHLIRDDYSYVILRDLIDLAYNDQNLPTEKMSLYDYSEYEPETFQTPQYIQSSTYYKEKFKGIELTKLSERANGKIGNIEKASIPVLKSLVDDFCAQHELRPILLFMAAFGIVLSKFSRAETIFYSTINHGRNDKKLSDIFGMFVKTVPILMEVKEASSVLNFIKSHKQELISTIRNGIYPFTHLCQQIGINPDITFGFQGSNIKEECELLGEHTKATQLLSCGLSAENPSVIIYETNTEYEIRLQYVDCHYEVGYMQ